MKQSIQKFLGLALISGLLSVCAITPAMAYWHDGYHYHYHDHYYHHDHYYYGGGNELAAGLLVGGAVGFMAASSMAAPAPVYVENHYYEAPPVCYKKKAWSRKFCNDSGCFIKTAWKTVCD